MDANGFNSAPTVRETTPSPVRTRGAATQSFQTTYRVYRAIGLHQLSYHILRGYHDATASA